METLIDTRVGQLVRQLSSDTSPQGSVRGQLAVQFFEKKRKKGGGLGWFSGGKAEEEICWEIWRLEVTLATPKTELGSASPVQKEQALEGLTITSRTNNGAAGSDFNSTENRSENSEHGEPR